MYDSTLIFSIYFAIKGQSSNCGFPDAGYRILKPQVNLGSEKPEGFRQILISHLDAEKRTTF
jgi:hypothetical protein